MPVKIGVKQNQRIGEVNHDLRDSKEFKDFKKEVLKFVKTEKTVSWRQLNEKFYYNAYWLTMAVEELHGKGLTLEADRMPERIVAK